MCQSYTISTYKSQNLALTKICLSQNDRNVPANNYQPKVALQKVFATCTLAIAISHQGIANSVSLLLVLYDQLYQP